QAITALASRPAQTIPWLRKRLRPVPRADAHRVARWIADLDSNRFAVRRRAARELEHLAEQAEPALRQALAGRPSPEVRRGIMSILAQLRNDRLDPPPDRLRTARAVEVLEQIGSAEARQFLSALAGGAPGVALTLDARGALERLDPHAERTR